MSFDINTFGRAGGYRSGLPVGPVQGSSYGRSYYLAWLFKQSNSGLAPKASLEGYRPTTKATNKNERPQKLSATNWLSAFKGLAEHSKKRLAYSL